MIRIPDTKAFNAALRDVSLGVVLSGLGPILVRESPVGPAATAFWRFILAAPVAFRLAREGAHLPLKAVLLAMLAGALLGADIILWNRAVLTTSMVEATVLVMIYPFLVAIGGWAIFGERIGSRVFAGGLAAFVGIVLLGVDGGGGSSSTVGNALALIAAFFYAGSLLVTARLCRRHDSTLVTAWSVLGAAITSLPFGLMETAFAPQGLASIGFIVMYGAVTLASYLLVARGLRHVPAALAAILGFGMPLIGTGLGALLYGEIPGPLDMAGAFLILCGIAWAVRQAPQTAQA